MNDRQFFIVGVAVGFLSGVVAVMLTLLVSDLALGVDGRERQFRKAEDRWNWQLIDERKSCRESDGLRSCTSFLVAYDGAFGPERTKLIAWVCTPRSCTWLLEP